MIELTAAEICRFWSRVKRGDGCWLWDGEVNNHGYGRFTIYRNGQRIRLLAHRVAYVLVTGEDIDGELARHQCDNPPCCNPVDLIPGTQQDNIQDAVERGRHDSTGLDIGRSLNRVAALAVVEAGGKTCPGCTMWKVLNDFHRAKRQLHGRQSRCKMCQRDERLAKRSLESRG
jgi:hypothetical protein